jgi:hypothetical protein
MSDENEKQFSVELDAETYHKLLAFCEGRDVCLEIYSLLCWAEKSLLCWDESEPVIPAAAKTAGRYYDTDKPRTKLSVEEWRSIRQSGTFPTETEGR